MDKEEEKRFLEFKDRYLKDKNLMEECRKALNYCPDKKLISVKLAKKGDKEQLQHLQEENKLRKEKGLPTVEVELMKMLPNEE